MNKCIAPDGRVEFTDKPCQTDAPKIKSPHNDAANIKTTNTGIKEVTTISILAGSKEEEGDADGTGTTARFKNPTGLTSDGKNIYITETGNNIVRKIELATGKVTTLAGSVGKRGSYDGIGSDARFNSPHGITNDGTNLYVADKMNHAIRKIVIKTGEVTTLAGDPAISGSADGVGKEAQFMFPEDVTTDGANLYVTDPTISTIRKIEVASRQVTTFAGHTVIDRNMGYMTGYVDGKGQAVRFGNPTGIACDGKNLYIADEYNNNIRKVVISTGEVTTLAGPDEAICVAGWKNRCPGGIVDGTGSNARFSYPQYLATDGTYVYVTASNNTIRRITIATGEVATLISAEAQSTTGSAIAYQLKKAWGVIVSDNNTLVITDRVAHVIYKLQ